MMTASRSRYSLLYFLLLGFYFPLLGFIPLYFPAFLGFTAAFNRHFRADFRLCYGILADSAFLCVVIGIIKEHPAVCLYAARCSVFVYSVSFACFFSLRGFV